MGNFNVIPHCTPISKVLVSYLHQKVIGARKGTVIHPKSFETLQTKKFITSTLGGAITAKGPADTSGVRQRSTPMASDKLDQSANPLPVRVGRKRVRFDAPQPTEDPESIEIQGLIVSQPVCGEPVNLQPAFHKSDDSRDQSSICANAGGASR